MLSFIVFAAVVGFLTWAVTRYVPMPPAVAQVIVGGVVVMLVIYLLHLLFGFGPPVLR